MTEIEHKLLEVHLLLGETTIDKIDIDVKIKLAKKVKEAIEVIRCCTELKDKEVKNFYEWLVFNNYSYYRDEMFYDKDDNIWFESQLEEKYKKEHNL